MGHAMEYLLSPRHSVRVWTRKGVRGEEGVTLEAAAGESNFVIFCVPANPIAELAARTRPHLKPDTLCASMAKGLDEYGRTAAGAFAATFGDGGPFGVMYGPMIAEEIRVGRPGFAQFGTANRADFARFAALFAGTTLYLEHTTDIEGISWAAVLKNVYVMLFGVSDELGLGDNTRGYLAAAVMGEMVEVIAALGAGEPPLCSLAGLGDLVTTATSAGSHHRELGRRLARGERDADHGEGLHTLAILERRELIDVKRYPLLSLVRAIAADPERTAQLVRAHLEGMRNSG